MRLYLIATSSIATALLSISLTTAATPALADPAWLARFTGSGTDQPTKIVADKNGNSYVTGRSGTDGYLDVPDFLTVKYDSSGNVVWTRRLDYNKGWDVPHSIAVDGSGNVYVSGESQIANNSRYGFLTVKYDTNGNELWRRRLDAADSSFGNDMAIDANGNVYVTGTVWATNNNDVLTAKYNSNGDFLWQQQYNGSVSGIDTGKKIALDSVGNVYVGATSDSSASSKTTLEDILVLKMTNDGALLWNRRIEGPGIDVDDNLRQMVVDAHDNVIVSGDSVDRSGARLTDILTVKLDSNGNELWRKLHDGPAHAHDYPNGLALDAADNVIMTGLSVAQYPEGQRADFITIKYDAAGNAQWERRYRGYNYIQSAATAVGTDANGNVFVGGWGELPKDASNIGTAFTNKDYQLVKYDTNGNLLWSQHYNGPGNNTDEVTSLAVDVVGNAIVTGTSFSGTTTYMDFVTIRYVDGAPFPEYFSPPPPTQPVLVSVSSYSMIQGSASGSGTAALSNSDNSYLVLTPSTRTKPVQVVFEGTSPVTTPSAMSYVLEAGVTQSNISIKIELFNFKTNAYEQVSSGAASIGDTQYGKVLSGDLTRFFKAGTNTVRSRLTFTPGSGVPNWKANVDQFQWSLTL